MYQLQEVRRSVFDHDGTPTNYNSITIYTSQTTRWKIGFTERRANQKNEPIEEKVDRFLVCW